MTTLDQALRNVAGHHDRRRRRRRRVQRRPVPHPRLRRQGRHLYRRLAGLRRLHPRQLQLRIDRGAEGAVRPSVRPRDHRRRHQHPIQSADARPLHRGHGLDRQRRFQALRRRREPADRRYDRLPGELHGARPGGGEPGPGQGRPLGHRAHDRFRARHEHHLHARACCTSRKTASPTTAYRRSRRPGEVYAQPVTELADVDRATFYGFTPRLRRHHGRYRDGAAQSSRVRSGDAVERHAGGRL